MRTGKAALEAPLEAGSVSVLNLTESVAERLSQSIAEGGIAPGQPLPSEDALSQTFAVSKRVIREALRTLTAQGIVKTSQGKRAVVANPDPVAMEAYFRFMRRLDARAIIELHELREVIEVRATWLAATRATDKDLEPARAAVVAMAEAGDDAEKYIAGDLAFHAAIMKAAHNRFLSAIVDALSSALWEERKLGVLRRLEAGHGPETALREHGAILDALAERGAEEASRRMAAHLRTGLIYLKPTHRGRDWKPGGSRRRSRKTQAQPA